MGVQVTFDQRAIPSIFNAHQNILLQVISTHLRGIDSSILQRLDRDLSNRGDLLTSEVAIALAVTLVDTVERNIQNSKQEKGFRVWLKKQLLERGYLVLRGDENYQPTAPEKLTMQQLHEVTYEAEAMPKDPV